MNRYKRVRAIIDDEKRCCVAFSNEHHRSTYIDRMPEESANDRNDRAIRVAAHWYTQHLKGQAQVLLLTNDAENRRRALSEGLLCLTLRQYVEEVIIKTHPDIGELLAHDQLDSDSKEKTGYANHLPSKQLNTLILGGQLKKGTFRVNRDFWSQGQVGVRGITDPVIIPNMDCMNRAVDGDIVALQILSDAEVQAELAKSRASNSRKKQETDGVAAERKYGKVVGIVQRNWRQYCGSLQMSEKKSGNVLFLPVDQRFPKVRISSLQIETLMDKRIMVQIDSWPADSHYPLGHYVKTLGPIGDRDTETQVLLIEHEVEDTPWSQKVLDCLPPQDFKITVCFILCVVVSFAFCFFPLPFVPSRPIIPFLIFLPLVMFHSSYSPSQLYSQQYLQPEEAAKRLDIRETRLVCSIDPPGCKDIDDALHIHKLDNGNFEVAVHIADVTYFVPSGCALDVEAQSRGTSVYLVERRIDMIPSLLSTDLCSLVGNVDRLAFSVFWEMTPDAEIVDTRFTRTVIRSRAALSYGQAQDMLDDPKANDPIATSVKNLNMIAKILRRNRMEAGALTLASPEVKFLLDSESQKPTDVEMYQLREANALVEEFMLLANISVAKKILEHFPTFSLLRRHPVPTPASFEPLIKAGGIMGFDINPETSKTLNESLDKVEIEGYPYFNKLFRILTTRCMTQAVYFSTGEVEPSEYLHYGLAAPLYTHFTSPIRRYADVVVHRLLGAAIGIAPLPPALEDSSHISDICENINHRNRMAQLAGRASVQLYTHIFFREKRVEEEAMVLSVRKNGIRVIVPKYGIEGSIHLSATDEQDDGTEEEEKYFEFDEDDLVLTTPKGKFKIFDRLKVVIYVHTSQWRRSHLRIDLIDDTGTTIIKDKKMIELGPSSKRRADASPSPPAKDDSSSSKSRSKSKGKKKGKKKVKTTH